MFAGAVLEQEDTCVNQKDYPILKLLFNLIENPNAQQRSVIYNDSLLTLFTQSSKKSKLVKYKRILYSYLINSSIVLEKDLFEKIIQSNF